MKWSLFLNVLNKFELRLFFKLQQKALIKRVSTYLKVLIQTNIRITENLVTI